MNSLEITKQEVHKLLALMGYICVEPTEIKEREGRISVSLFVDKPYEIIGEGGKSLSAFQHVARLCLARKLSVQTTVDVDINHYKKKREEFITELARQAGERARFNQKAIELEPMSPFDRRVVHYTIAEYSDLATESVGEGFDRHVVIRPYP
jgi:spoIIIJ-associated protein